MDKAETAAQIDKVIFFSCNRSEVTVIHCHILTCMAVGMQNIISELLERLNRNMYGDVPNISLKPFRKLTDQLDTVSAYEEEHVSIVLAN
jgi:hypothetical protein